MKAKINPDDLLTIRNLELDLENMKLKCELKLNSFQKYLDSIWERYGLRKGIDTIEPDGTININELGTK